MSDIWRLSPPAGHPFRGTRIDRGRRISFTLNGTPVTGFAGDTLYSALAANGFSMAGSFMGAPLGITEQFAPRLAVAGSVQLPQALLSPQRTLAEDGLDYVVADRPAVSRWRKMTGRGRLLPPDLEAQISDTLTMPRGDIDPEGEETDIIIVGAGIAGMKAALTAAMEGLKVVLIERRAHIGGGAALFGALEDEPKPQDAVAALEAELLAHENITVLTGTAILDVRDKTFLLSEAPRPPRRHNRYFRISASRVVVATGSRSPLPVAPGNRHPGVTDILDAYRLGAEHGVWTGNETVFWGATNIQYRLAMMARDAGIAVRRIFDQRPDPQSRFKEFAKAYGITFSAGMDIAQIQKGEHGAQLRGAFALGLGDNPAHIGESLSFDRLVTANGWQPDLQLWVRLGGKLYWQDKPGHFVAGAAPDGVAIAGSAGGWESVSACMASGEAAIRHLLGQPADAFEDKKLDDIYETPDSVMRPRLSQGTLPAFLSSGASLVRADLVGKDTLAPARISLCDASALAKAGLVTPAQGSRIIAQRSGDTIMLAPSTFTSPGDGDAGLIDDAMAQTVLGPDWETKPVRSADGRTLETGAFIYAGSDKADPLSAIGIVLENGTAPRAGFKAGVETAAKRLVVRSTAGMSYVTLD